jgi:hypothetical protein
MTLDQALELFSHWSWPTTAEGWAIAVIAMLIVVRTAADAFIRSAQYVDRRDGKEDWPIFTELAKYVEVFDSWLERLPIKAIYARSRKK